MQNLSALAIWNKLKRNAIGRWLFSRAVCFKAPYFASISPVFRQLEIGHSEVFLKKRRKVQNHIGTVHAIAMANLCEIAAGTMTEVSVPISMRWIPKTMTIDYLAKAETDVTASASLQAVLGIEPHDVTVSVDVRDATGEIVVHAEIVMYLSPKMRTASSTD